MTLKELLVYILITIVIATLLFLGGYSVGEVDGRHYAQIHPESKCYCGNVYERKEGYWEETLARCSIKLPTECERKNK